MPLRSAPSATVFLAATLAIAALGCFDEGLSPVPSPYHFERATGYGEGAYAIAERGERLYVASPHGLVMRSEGVDVPLAAEGLPAGFVNGLLAFEGEVLVAYVWGKGVFRSIDGGASFAPSEPLPPYTILEGLVTPRARVVPYGGATDPHDGSRGVWAGPGGLYLTRDAGATFELIDTAVGDSKLYALFLDADISGQTIAAIASAPATLLPPSFASLVGGGVVVSRDGGATWNNETGDLPVRALTSVAIGDDGSIYAGAMDGGVFRIRDGDFKHIGGPNDVVALTAFDQGVSVGSGTRGLWRYDPAGWSHIGAGAVTSLSARHALTYDGALYELAIGLGDPPPPPAGGIVHLALSFHVNLYHSYRGDTNDENGYGLDIDVIRHTLDWLDAYPLARADWDMENYFSVDGWLATEAPDIIDRVRQRRQAGTDDVRLMSWNNGAMSASTYDEFEAAVERAKQSNTDAFGGFVPGVQPQENMFQPDHVGWYRQLGIDWITLFYSMSPFTGFPLDHELSGADLYGVAELTNGVDTMSLLPVYHHADVYDHGGLRGWMQQISDTIAGDTLLVIHFDADGETWLNFDAELANIEGLDFVRYTTLQEYLDGHAPITSVHLQGDQADGIGDGYQSWAEKDINHEIYTGIAVARERVRWAELIAPDDTAVRSLIQDALTPRLLALSTTNFGLASPFLNPMREQTARDFVQQSKDAAQLALDAAEASSPVTPGTIQLVSQGEGPALIDVPIAIPLSAYVDPSGLVIAGDVGEIPLAIEVLDDTVDPVQLMATLVTPLTGDTTVLTWTYDPANPSTAMGAVVAADLTDAPVAVDAPFTECLGAGRTDAELDNEGPVSVDSRLAHAERRDDFTVPFCGASGTLERTIAVHDGLDGVVVTVDAQMGEPTDALAAESVALTPLSCDGDVATIDWRTFGGTTASRPARLGQESWNGQAADGWVVYGCASGARIHIAHRVLDRTSIAFSPLRNDDGQAVFAPLGTLWGDSPWHFARRIGGIGVGDIVGIITPQYNPTAPDWAGKTIRYRLLIGDDLDEATMDRFAHPPLVRVGAYVAP